MENKERVEKIKFLSRSTKTVNFDLMRNFWIIFGEKIKANVDGSGNVGMVYFHEMPYLRDNIDREGLVDQEIESTMHSLKKELNEMAELEAKNNGK